MCARGRKIRDKKGFSEEASPWRGDFLHKAQAKECLRHSVLVYCFIVLLYICLVPGPI